MLKKNNSVKYLFTAAAGLVLAACGASPDKTGLQLEPVNGETIYKRSVYFNTTNAELQQHIETTLYKHDALELSHEPSFNEFNVNLQKVQTKGNVFSKGPRLFGALKKDNRPASTTFKYSLTTFNGKKLDQGEVVGVGEAQEHYLPSLVLTTDTSPEMLADVSQQLVNIVQTQARGTPWRAAVIGHKDQWHVSIGAGETAGLRIGDVFVTETLPKSTLQVMSFEESPSGQSRAILRTIEGLQPTAGRMVIPSARLQMKK